MKYLKNIGKKSLIAVIMILGLYISVSGVVSADEPAVVNVVTDPSNPAPESTVTVTAYVSVENISALNITVTECSGVSGTCFEPRTVMMTEKSTSVYEAEVTLTNTKTTYIEYFFEITYNNGSSGRIENESWKIDLDLGSGDDDTPNDNKDSDEKGIPGFELITLLVAVIIGILFFKRKRLR